MTIGFSTQNHKRKTSQISYLDNEKKQTTQHKLLFKSYKQSRDTTPLLYLDELKYSSIVGNFKVLGGWLSLKDQYCIAAKLDI